MENSMKERDNLEKYMYETTTQGSDSNPSRKTAAQEVFEFAQALVELSEKVRIQADKRLALVVLPSIEEDEKVRESKRKLPLFFEDLWCRLETIRYNLNLISDLLYRTDL